MFIDEVLPTWKKYGAKFLVIISYGWLDKDPTPLFVDGYCMEALVCSIHILLDSLDD